MIKDKVVIITGASSSIGESGSGRAGYIASARPAWADRAAGRDMR